MNKRKFTDGKISLEKKLKRDDDFGDEEYDLELRYPKSVEIINYFRELIFEGKTLRIINNTNVLSIKKNSFIVFINKESEKDIIKTLPKTNCEIENEIYSKHRTDNNLLLNFRILFEDFGKHELYNFTLMCEDYSISFNPKNNKFFMLDTLFAKNCMKSDISYEETLNQYGKLCFDDEIYEILLEAYNICIEIIMTF